MLNSEAVHSGRLTRKSDEFSVMEKEQRGQPISLMRINTGKKNRMTNDQKTKSYEIPKREVFEAWKRVKSNKGSAGVDGISIEQFEMNLSKNLYKVWNRMSHRVHFFAKHSACENSN